MRGGEEEEEKRKEREFSIPFPFDFLSLPLLFSSRLFIDQERARLGASRDVTQLCVFQASAWQRIDTKPNRNKLTIFLFHFLGTSKDGNPVYLRDIWPTREELQVCVH